MIIITVKIGSLTFKALLQYRSKSYGQRFFTSNCIHALSFHLESCAPCHKSWFCNEKGWFLFHNEFTKVTRAHNCEDHWLKILFHLQFKYMNVVFTSNISWELLAQYSLECPPGCCVNRYLDTSQHLQQMSTIKLHSVKDSRFLKLSRRAHPPSSLMSP